jgi:hypothetical protein
LLAATNYAAIVRPLQIIVLAVAGLFLLRVMRVAMVEMRPPKQPKVPRSERKKEPKPEKGPKPEKEPKPPREPRASRRRSALALEFIEPTQHAGEVLDVVDAFTLGRNAGCDVVVEDIYLSGRHARFSHDDGDLLVEDLQSTNGTYVNQRLISHRTRLERGDIVQVGGVLFEVVR